MARDRETTDSIIIHCTATPPEFDCTLYKIHQWHANRGIMSRRGKTGYHWYIRRTGEIFTGRELMEIGAHAAGLNATSVGIALEGGVDSSGAAADNYTEAQLLTLEMLLRGLQSTFDAPVILGHNAVSNKACPAFRWADWLQEKGLQ